MARYRPDYKLNQELHKKVLEDQVAGKKLHLRRGVDLQVCHSPGVTPAIVFLHGGLGI